MIIRFIRDDLLTKNQFSRPGHKMRGVLGVVLHWTGNPGSTAKANRDYFESLKNQSADDKKARYASAHYVIGLKGEIIRCIPEDEFAWHTGARDYTRKALAKLGVYPNNCVIGIELCHAGADGAFNGDTIAACKELVDMLLKSYSLTRKDVWRHYDITGKICPKYFVENEAAYRELFCGA